MLVPRMMQQVQAADHQFMFKKYKRCFTGSDAVTFFLSKRFARTEEEAIAIGNALLHAGVFRHVRNEHLFRNGNYFYRFAAHEEYAIEDEAVNLRSSRMMSVACNSHIRMPELYRIDTGPPVSRTNQSDVTNFSFEETAMFEERPEFGERDVTVETGIRIGRRMFPNLVSKFTQAQELISDNVVNKTRYEKSFIGKNAVKWLVSHHYAKSTREAIGICNAMLCSGVFFPLAMEHGGFECDDVPYRLMADIDVSKELRRGARKDILLKYFLGIDRGKPGKEQAQQSPWFEDSFSFSFTSESSAQSR